MLGYSIVDLTSTEGGAAGGWATSTDACADPTRSKTHGTQAPDGQKHIPCIQTLGTEAPDGRKKRHSRFPQR